MENNARKTTQKFLVSIFGLLLIAASPHKLAAQTNTFPSSGNVGVGGTAPVTPLEVYGPVISTFTGNTRGALSIGVSGSTTNLYYRAIDFLYSDSYGPAARIAMKYDASLGSFLYFGTSNNTVSGVTNSALVIDPTGNVGIGTTTPTSVLTVQTTGTDTNGDKYLRIKSTNSYSGLMLDPGQAGDAGWLMMGGYPNAGDFTIREYGVGNYFTIKKTTGNVGFGTTSPVGKLEVTGSIYSSASETNTVFSGAVGNNNAAFVGPQGYWAFRSDTSHRFNLDVYNSGSPFAAFTVNQSGNVGIGTNNPQKPLDVVGDVNASGTITGGTIVARYQDVAEWVPASHALPAGTVVTLDPKKSNHVEASSQSYDTRVAGVVSEQPGITLGESGENKVLVATTGRVRVTVDASHAPIHIGDLLVTSDRPGVAMKSEPITIGGRQIHSPGTLIGKALEPLEKGSGKILVLLSLQ